MHTLIEILDRSTRYLEDHGIPDARRNAELLAGHVLGKSRLELYLEHDRPLESHERRQMREVLAQRKARMPLQYIFGETEFYGFPLKVNPSVLIPRPETELLVEEALRVLEGCGQPKPVVYDIGTGSGCIAVAIAGQCESCRIYASDISAESLKTALANARSNGVEDRIEFLLGSDAAPFRGAHAEKADLIVANLPYVPTADIALLEPEVRDNEPRCALDGGADGLDVVRRIVPEAPSVMRPGASLILETGIGESDGVTDLLRSTGLYAQPVVTKDYRGIDRIVTVRLKG